MNTLKKLSILILLFCIVLPARAQFNMLFTSDYDLPNSLVNCIAEDKDGMVWIATEDGLSRYNGSSFVTYKQIPGNPNSIQDNFVRCVCVDKRGHVFVGILIIAAVITPTGDPFTLMLVTLPVYMLYELSIWII